MKNHTQIITTLNDEIIIQVHKLFLKEWWTKTRSITDTKFLIDKSDITFSLIELETNKLLGFARVLTDWIDTALIMDVIVNEEYRGRGFGKQIVDTITSFPDLNKVKRFDLHCKSKLEEFYNKSNFVRTPEMIWLRKNS